MRRRGDHFTKLLSRRILFMKREYRVNLKQVYRPIGQLVLENVIKELEILLREYKFWKGFN